MKFDQLYKIMVNEALTTEPTPVEGGDVADEAQGDDVDVATILSRKYRPKDMFEAHEVLALQSVDLSHDERKNYSKLLIGMGLVGQVKNGQSSPSAAFDEVEKFYDQHQYEKNLAKEETPSGMKGHRDEESGGAGEGRQLGSMSPEEAKALGVNPEIEDDPFADPENYNYGD